MTRSASLLRTRSLACSVALGTWLRASSVLYAQDAPSPSAVTEGRAHFDRGIGLFRQQDFDGALAEFLRAYELARRPTVLFNIAASYQALHRYADAVDALRDYLANARDASARQRAAAEAALHDLEGLIAHVRVSVEPADAAVAVDGRAVTDAHGVVTVGPGRHRVEATRAGYQPGREEFMIASGEERTVRLVLPVVPTAPTSTAAPAPVVAPPPARARLVITGAPAASSLRIAGRVHAVTAPLELAPGDYPVVVAAAGRRPWAGELRLAPGTTGVLRVDLVPAETRLAPRYFWIASATTGVLTAGAITLGALTMATNADFQSRTRDDPETEALARRGHASGLAADVTGLAALALGAATVFLFTRTEFSVARSTAVLTAGPMAGGAALGLHANY